jgi:diketogulonate reductase-like aldo/keto reductase
MQHVSLNNGVKMPIVGFGAFQIVRDEALLEASKFSPSRALAINSFKESTR